MPASDRTHRRTATLLLHHVAQAYAAKARAYLQVGGHRLRRRWRAVDDGDADVMLLGSTDPQTVPGVLDEPAVTLRLLDHPEDGADTRVALVRPLQYGPFIDALLAAESRLERLGGPPDEPAARIEAPLEPPPDPLAHEPVITTIPDRLAAPREAPARRRSAPLPDPICSARRRRSRCAQATSIACATGRRARC